MLGLIRLLHPRRAGRRSRGVTVGVGQGLVENELKMEGAVLNEAGRRVE